MSVHGLAVEDSKTIDNALARGPSTPAVVSFDTVWHGVKEVQRLRDTTNHFAGTFILDSAQAAWSATEEGFSFESDPAETSTTVFAELGFERNGVFFR